MSDNKRYYIPSQQLNTLEGYPLNITYPTRTVYCSLDNVTHKLDSLWLRKLKVLCICLPNGRLCKIIANKEGKLKERPERNPAIT